MKVKKGEGRECDRALIIDDELYLSYSLIRHCVGVGSEAISCLCDRDSVKLTELIWGVMN